MEEVEVWREEWRCPWSPRAFLARLGPSVLPPSPSGLSGCSSAVEPNSSQFSSPWVSICVRLEPRPAPNHSSSPALGASVLT